MVALVEQERERCAKAACERCNRGVLLLHDDDSQLVHEDSIGDGQTGWFDCDAAKIREGK